MVPRPNRRSNASTSPENLAPDEWTVRLDFSRTHWLKFKKHVEEAYRAHVKSAGYSRSPWLDVPTERITVAESEIVDLWRGTAVDRGARPGELHDCIAQSLRHHHESQQVLAPARAFLSTDSQVDNTRGPDSSALDADLELLAHQAADLPADSTIGGSGWAELEGGRVRRIRVTRPESPSSSASFTSSQYEQPEPPSQRPVDAESTPHTNGHNGHDDAASGRSANQQANDAAPINQHLKASNQKPPDPPPRHPWYEEEIAPRERHHPPRQRASRDPKGLCGGEGTT